MEHILNVTVKLFLTIICGTIIGLEREIRGEEAGLQIHVLVCLGACAFGALGLRLHSQFPGEDILRLAQGLLVGLGFLCAGIIFREGKIVKGLITATGIWVMGAIGLSIGVGCYNIALITTAITFFVIALFGRVGQLLKK